MPSLVNDPETILKRHSTSASAATTRTSGVVTTMATTRRTA